MSTPLREHDLNAYLRRVAFQGRPSPDLETLRQLHRCHPQAIAFENLSTLMGESVPLELDALVDKLVGAGRGGYCFEHNGLFAAVLETLGFEVTTLAARVSWGREPGRVGGRTHMLMSVRIAGRDFICDVGFGGVTLNMPLLLEVDVEQAGPQERFRMVMRNDGEYELFIELSDGWQSMYRFDLQPQGPGDYEAMNRHVSTHRDSPFIANLMAARRTAEGRHALSNTRLRTYRGVAVIRSRQLGNVAELRGVLGAEFGIRLPEHGGLDAALARIVAHDA